MFLVRRVEAVIAGKLLYGVSFSVDLMGEGAWRYRYRLRRAYQRARKFADHQLWSLGGRFFMFSLLEAEHMAGIL